MKYPERETDWICPRYGTTACRHLRFPNHTIFYAKRPDGTMRFAYVKNGELLYANDKYLDSIIRPNPLTLNSLVSKSNRDKMWRCGELFVILPDTKEHISIQDYREKYCLD